MSITVRLVEAFCYAFGATIRCAAFTVLDLFDNDRRYP